MRGHWAEAGRILTQVIDSQIAKWIAGCFASLWAFVGPSEASKGVSFALIVLVALDMATGVRVSIKRGNFLSSRCWNRIIDKILAYGVLILLPGIVKNGLPEYEWLTPVTLFVLGMAAFGEFISLTENLGNLGLTWVKPIAKALRVRFGSMISEQEEAISGVPRQEKQP
jgi:phage-related holin